MRTLIAAVVAGILVVAAVVFFLGRAAGEQGATARLASQQQTTTRQSEQGPAPSTGGQATPGQTQPQAGSAQAAVTCPTDAQMQDAHGFTARGIKPVATGGGLAWEGCKWQIQAVGFASIDIPFLPDWEYTVTLDDSHQTVAVFYGEPNLTRKIFGASIRYRPFYNTADNNWVNRPCDRPTATDQGGLLAREFQFGVAPPRGTLTYQTVPGNIACT